MKIIYKIFIFVFISFSLFSQERIEELTQERIGEPKNMSFSRQASNLQVETMPYDLIIPFIEDNLFGFCVEVYDLTFSGSPDAFGAFSYSGEELGLDEGMIMSTGSALSAVGPNEQTQVTTQFYTAGDQDLNSLTEYLTFDACVIEFDFLAASDNLLACEFVFASEEYPEFIGSMFNDIFGFFISEPYEDVFGDLDPNFNQELQNIAYLPGTNSPISINTISPNVNPEYYIDNCLETNNDELQDVAANYAGDDIEYDAFSIPISLEAEIKKDVLYHLKIAIADASDPKYDTSLFLKSNSFESGVNAEIGNIIQNALTVSFENNSLGSTFLWTFGDGTYSEEENPVHQYSSPGIYVVTLDVMDDSACGTSQSSIIITVNNIDDISIEENELNYKIFYEKKFNQIRIEGIDLNKEYYLNLYNSLGMQKKQVISSDIINVSNIGTGVYFVEIKNQNGNTILLEKIVIY
jgi:hypothetical protein